jgi:MFS family permease
MTNEDALQFSQVVTMLGLLLMLIAPFYKALMDKLGRMPIFIMNTAGMALGLFIAYLAPNYWVMVLGQLTVTFFVIHDMQMVYVYEAAPPKWRSTMYFGCKFVGIFGTLSIPLLRSVFMNSDASNWRPLYLVPAVIGAGIFVLALMFMRESDIFLKNQIEYLSTPYEKRKKDGKDREERKSGIGAAFRLCFKNRQIRWLMTAAFFAFAASTGITANYEMFMTADAGMTTQAVTAALTFQIIAMGISQLITGLLADFIGRKPTIALFTAVVALALILFVVLTPMGIAPWIVGVLLGLLIGCFWNVTDLIGMIIAESAPTELRGSSFAVQGLVSLASLVLSTASTAVLLGFTNLGSAKIIVGLPGIITALAVVLLKTKETKGADLEKAGREEETQ